MSYWEGSGYARTPDDHKTVPKHVVLHNLCCSNPTTYTILYFSSLSQTQHIKLKLVYTVVKITIIGEKISSITIKNVLLCAWENCLQHVCAEMGHHQVRCNINIYWEEILHSKLYDFIWDLIFITNHFTLMVLQGIYNYRLYGSLWWTVDRVYFLERSVDSEPCRSR
jgi:hypothetical protein